MAEQQPMDDKKGVPAVKSSIKRLKEKFVPGLKYTLLITATFNLAMLIVGCVNVHNCPVNKNIPLFLIATGAIGIVSKFVSYVRNRLLKLVQVMYIESALYSVETVFFLLGTYWVYKEFQPSYDPMDKLTYCNKTAYLFGFVYLTVYYAIIIAILLGFFCFLCCTFFVIKTALRNEEATPETTEAAENLNQTNDGETKT